MAIDSLTIAAIVGALGAAGVMIFLQSQKDKATAQRMELLHKEIRRMHDAPHLPTHASRELCCAIRRIYPEAVHGVDYQLADEGEGPYIKEWLMEKVPEPEIEHLAEAINDHRADAEKNAYREARHMAYPSVGDQLDALHKARMGDSTELEMLDVVIERVKERYPKHADCEENCS
ncbi:MAG: XkdW family protein [Gammaproteobacteria bacterium]